jgi:hypothetical protein
MRGECQEGGSWYVTSTDTFAFLFLGGGSTNPSSGGELERLRCDRTWDAPVSTINCREFGRSTLRALESVGPWPRAEGSYLHRFFGGWRLDCRSCTGGAVEDSFGSAVVALAIRFLSMDSTLCRIAADRVAFALFSLAFIWFFRNVK